MEQLRGTMSKRGGHLGAQSSGTNDVVINIDTVFTELSHTHTQNRDVAFDRDMRTVQDFFCFCIVIRERPGPG